jgi:CubicO group peptidase (beta-lactamase class C family)
MKYRRAPLAVVIGGLGLLAAGCVDAAPPAGGATGGAPAAHGMETRRVTSTGLDSALLETVAGEAAALPRLRTLLIARHGELELAKSFRGPGLDAPANVKSVSKSILSAVAGIAIAEGHLTGPDHEIGPFFARHLAADSDSAKRRITVGHLLSMQSGLESTSGRNYGRWVSSSNWVRDALARPLIAEPGSVRQYSTGNSHLLAAILTQATGTDLRAYAHRTLAEPLGIALPRWPADPQGVFFGGNEMRLTPRALLRFGELYRNGGMHDGRQVVPADWVQASLTPRTEARRTGEGYGYGWFISQVRGYPMFYAWGYGGQFIFVVPDLELTVVTTSDPDVERERDHLQAVRRLLRDLIVPAAELGQAGRTVA